MHLLELITEIMSEELNKEITPEQVEEVAVKAVTREDIIARLQEIVGDISIAKRPELE